MEENSKQRIIGIIVVGVIVVVALPFLLRSRPQEMRGLPEPKQRPIADALKERTDKVSQVVEQATPRLKEALSPSTASSPTSSPQLPAKADEGMGGADAPSVVPPKGQAVLPALPENLESQQQSSRQAIPQTGPITSAKHVTSPTHHWVVQLGTFQHKAYADRLVLRLKKAGYHPYLHKEYSTEVAGLQGSRAVLYRVWVPSHSQLSAHKKLRQLREKMRLEGIIVNKPHGLQG